MNNSIIAVYKPKGWTSHDVIDKLRVITKVKRIGHAGTLDPLAEGVLVVGIGREATKRLNLELAKEKEYEAVIKLGEASTTGDEEGEKTKTKVMTPPSRAEVEQVLKKFIGEIEQIPPIYSAIKINGRAAYKYARAGQAVEIKSRMVKVHEIKILNYDWPLLSLKVTTGPGVYIRSLAQDLGEKLETGGYLFGLVRTRVGEFVLDKTKTIEQITREGI